MDFGVKRAYFETVGYEPHSRQLDFHMSQARFRAPCCGRRYGKSKMAAADLEPELFIPNRLYWIVGPTYDLGSKEFKYLWDSLIIRQKLGLDKRVKKAFSVQQGNMFIELPWGTRVEVRSATHPEALVGEALDGVIMSEAAKHHQETWERYIRPSLADRRGWATFPTTPEGFNWFYDLWMLGVGGDNREFKQYESWKFPSWANPHVYPGGENDPEIALLKGTSTPEWFMQEIGADFASFVGKIYSEFDPYTHVVPHVFRPDWPNYIAFDWGWADAFAAMEFQVSPQDDVYVWREHYGSRTMLEDHIAQLKARENPAGYHLDCGFGDAADPEAAEYVSTYYIGTYAEPDAKKNWRAGIDLVKRFLKARDTGVLDADGAPIMVPKFFVDPTCVNMIREFNNYRVREGARGMGPQDVPQKTDDHTLDAIRYGLMHLYELGVKSHLSDVMGLGALEGARAASDLGELNVTTDESGIFTSEMSW